MSTDGYWMGYNQARDQKQVRETFIVLTKTNDVQTCSTSLRQAYEPQGAELLPK